MPDVFQELMSAPLCTRAEVLSGAVEISMKSGIYGWWFKPETLIAVPHLCLKDCLKRNELCLLYLGIAPKRPSGSRTLAHRIPLHYKNDTSSSTLRTTLSCLLEIKLRHRGKNDFPALSSADEENLSKWMEENAFVSWVEYQEPWKAESQLIQSGKPYLPFNLRHQTHDDFHKYLTSLRDKARKEALSMKHHSPEPSP